MKKKITAADGSVHELEGTPEELAEYERKLGSGGSGPVAEDHGSGKRKLLKEEMEHVDLQKRMAEALDGLSRDVRQDAAERRAREVQRVVPSPWYDIYWDYPRYKFWTTSDTEIRSGDDCILRRFARENPGKPAMISCPCKLCSPQALVIVGPVLSAGTTFTNGDASQSVVLNSDGPISRSRN
jgi:hypothetical protein